MHLPRGDHIDLPSLQRVLDKVNTVTARAFQRPEQLEIVVPVGLGIVAGI